MIAVKGTKRDAERKLAEVVRDLDQGMFVEPSRLTLCGYLDQWMEDYVAHSVRPRTARGYGTIVKRIQTGSLSSTRLTSLNPNPPKGVGKALEQDITGVERRPSRRIWDGRSR